VSEPRNWFVLLHSPGPAIGEGERVFDHPTFAGHRQFLDGLASSGSLIAAGPLADTENQGMTIIEAPSFEEAKRLAEEDDPSIAAGAFAVTVRHWRVMNAPIADR
jgi:uncharacterized protein YciI